jgi:hypothetical protein
MATCTYFAVLALIFAQTVATGPAPTPGPAVGGIVLLRSAAAASGAVCLDGSPVALYIAPNVESQKVYIHQEGGGWCSPGLNCLQRANSSLGSSKTYPPTMDFDGGYLSSDPVQNPLMWVSKLMRCPFP